MSRFTRPVTPEEAGRIRLHLALIPLYLWIAFTWVGYAHSISTAGRLDRGGLLKGHDFAHFYVLGQMAIERRGGELYNATAQAERTQALAGQPHRYLPTYGPQVALLFAPLALMPYLSAWVAWTIASALLYGVSVYALWRAEPALHGYKWPTAMAAMAYPPFAMLIDFGHITALVLAAFTLAYLALCAKRSWLAGFALGCVFIKPPLGLILPFVLLYGREWRIIGGAAVAVALQLAVAWMYFGQDVLLEYVQVVSQFGRVAGELEPQPNQMQSLRSFFSVLLPWPRVALLAYLAASVPVVIVAARCWRTRAPLEIRYALLLVAAILVDPHVNAYDLVVIVPVFLLVAACAARQPQGWGLWVVLYAAYYSPIFAYVVSARLRIQVAVVLLVVLFALVARLARKGRREGDISASTAGAFG